MRDKFSRLASILIIALCLAWAVPCCHAQQGKKPFTIADDVGLTAFGNRTAQQAIRFSPEGSYLAVLTVRGRLDLNCVEDSLSFYRSTDVERFLKGPDAPPPSPVWVVNLRGKEGPIISDWRWLADSSGVAFLEGYWGNKRLVLADLETKIVIPLTPEGQSIRVFDIRDRDHYVYTAADLAEGKKSKLDRQAPAIVGTGHIIHELLFPDDPWVARKSSHEYLEAVIGGKPFKVMHQGAPLAPEGGLALSPDAQSLVTTLALPEAPSSWEALYPPPYKSSPYLIRAGKPTSQYVQIHLQTGSVRSLTDAPTSNAAGWWVNYWSSPNWSSDSENILLPGTFLKSNESAPSRPCVAIVHLLSNKVDCIEVLKGGTEGGGFEDGYHFVEAVRFIGGDKRRVMLNVEAPPDFTAYANEYQFGTDGTWQLLGQSKQDPFATHNDIEVTIKDGLNEPPVLLATLKKVSRIILNLNPELRTIELGEASLYTWKDKQGRDRRGGLFKPTNLKSGQRYPLVIQTHGFSQSEFIPSGWGPPFAARELAAAGIVVLQVGDTNDCLSVTPNEGPCAVSAYESAANQLASEGLVNPEKIGIIGFSRSCFYVMEALTANALHFKAASITDGWMVTYFQYMQNPESFSAEANAMIGAAPFGKGLLHWVEQSPGFNLDKVNTPLLVVGEGPISLLFMWEPYAGLHYLHKPVELVMLNTDEHVPTNPTLRMASQGGTVDWFRFWLQDYEDPDPAKAEQYRRWRELRKMQQENEAKAKAAAQTQSPTTLEER